MTRRTFLQQTAAAVAAGAVAAPAVAQSGPQIRWRLTSSFPKSLDTLFGAAEHFARVVGAATGGRFQISVHAPGEIVPAFQVVDAIQNNTVEMCHTAGYYFIGKDPTFAFDTAVPFGMNTRQHAAWITHGGGDKLLDDFFRGYGMKAFAGGSTTAQMGGWFRKEIKTLEDVKGLKFRIAGLGGVIMQRLGAVPQQIPGGDIYPALEKGTIDAAEWVGPYDDEKLGLGKVAKFYYYPAFWEGNAMTSFYVNAKQFDALPAEYRAIVQAAATEAERWMTAKYDAQNPAALKRIVGSGVQLRPFPRPMMEAAYKATQEFYAETAAKNENFRKIYEPWNRFRQDQVLWFRVAENTFDDFVASMK
jgi:TRAP-type mannitol/chloroaromatic compound transport system substrate-binding protein